MKLSSSGTGKTHKKSKSRQFTNTSNNFSEKYILYTKEKMFSSTPKKPQTPTKEFFSPRNLKELTQQKKTKYTSPYNSKSQKININMEIKNFNIYGPSNQGQPVRKKKLHKKTISCLNNLGKKDPQKQVKEKKVVIKHMKTKSQENLKLKPSQWGNLLSQYGKHQKQDSLISKFSVCNRTGFCPDKKDKVNQDTYINIENFMTKGRYLFGVCDGHGINGHYVSEFIRQILPQNIQFFFLKNKNMKKTLKGSVQITLKEAFQKTAKNLLQSGIDIMFSGTTACIVYIENHTLYCANLGDSRAVIFSREGVKDQEWSFTELSTDHKADDKREAVRIQMNGGRIFPYKDEDGQQMGPYRVWIQEQNIPGLAMTRSFGDYVASTVGVIDEPEIVTYEIIKENKFIVIASDGLWQFISNEQVLNVVSPAFVRNDPQGAVKQLQKMAVQAWQREDESIDDITIQVIFLKYY